MRFEAVWVCGGCGGCGWWAVSVVSEWGRLARVVVLGQQEHYLLEERKHVGGRWGWLGRRCGGCRWRQ